MTDRVHKYDGGHIVQRGAAVLLRVDGAVPMVLEFTGHALAALLLAAQGASLEKPRKRRAVVVEAAQ